MKQKQAIRINESHVNSLLKGTLNESYKDRCKIVGMYAFVQFFKLHPEKLQTLEPKWKERYEELSKYFDEHPLNMEMQAIYRREWPQLQGKQTINEYNGSDAIEDAENSGYEEDDPMYQYILQNGGGGVLYEKQAKNMKKSKQTIKLKEVQLRQIVKESIKKVLNETYSLPTDDNPKIMQQNVENLRIGILKNLSLFNGIKNVRVNFEPNCFDNGVDILEIEVTVNFNDRFLWHWVKKCEKEGKDSIDEYCKRLQNKINKIKILRYHKCLDIDDTNYLSNGEVVYRFYGVAEEDFEKDYFIR